MSKEGWMGLRILRGDFSLLVGCGVLYGPLIIPRHGALRRERDWNLHETQQCNTKLGCEMGIDDMTGECALPL